jgi:LmbE family N-acetylglucosaminyl deacetylase
MRRRTIVSFHAHPDDEALLTGGSLARAAADGHRVVLVVATDGEAGLASSALGPDLRDVRRRELEASARALGCARLVRLCFADSGWHDSRRAGLDVFSRLDVATAAAPLVEILREERADVLTTYDAAGGYGHPDHRQVHRVGALAARRAGTQAVLEATAPGERLHRMVRLCARVPGLLDAVDPQSFATAFSRRADITHSIDVRDHLDAKRDAMRAHASQATSDVGPRTLALLLRLPRPVFRAALGHEWFVDRSRPGLRCRDLFDGLDT